ncbi:MAG: c-type cytochrome [Nitrospirae bacterium]|nr:c-type cytochrome [Nitrospirota bacterium]
MTKREVAVRVGGAVCSVMLGVGVAYSGFFSSDEESLPPIPPVPTDYAAKHMPQGWWTDPKVIAEGEKVYTGDANKEVNCSNCHGKDGQPKKKGARDLRDPKNTTRFSDSFWFWRVAEGVPKTKMKAWKQYLSEEQIWQVIAYEHQFSHGFKPAEHADYKP